eukprot:13363805-Alexandrium_andersonii.AAC.1
MCPPAAGNPPRSFDEGARARSMEPGVDSLRSSYAERPGSAPRAPAQHKTQLDPPPSHTRCIY